MNKKVTSLLTFTLLFNFCGCKMFSIPSSTNSSSNVITSSSSPSTVKVQTELEKALLKLKDNNYSIDYRDSFYDNHNKVRNSKFYYTEYAFQGEGDFGFVGVAQGDDHIFRYTLSNNEVVAGLPLINSNTGTRYESIFDYQESYGMNHFDFSSLPTEQDDNGYYHYEFGKNRHNDKLILPIFLRFTPESLPPQELKIKVVKDVIMFEAIILSYDTNNDKVDDAFDTVSATVYDIGKTENKEIKKYLEDGKTSKTPLDMKFYQFFHPYLFSNNYSIDLDATKMKDNNGRYYTFQMTEYCTEDAILDVNSTSNSGFMLNQGYVTSFNIKNDKVNITGTQTNEDGDFLTSLYGEFVTYTMSSLTYDVLIGYKDDTNENVYYLTDSYLIYVLSYLCYNEVYDENYCDKVKLEIINEETYEFKLYFNMYNKKTNRDLGVFQARVYDLNNTRIPAVDEYNSLGDNPSTQTKDNLNNVLSLLKTHNYSMDGMTSAGMTKFYNTPNYFYLEVYGNPNANTGFIKEHDSIYEFYIENNEVIVDRALDYSKQLDMISVGDYYAASNDFGFISVISESIYNLDNYTKSTIHNQDYWKITDLVTANKILKYYLPYENIKSTGVGLLFKDQGIDSKLTFLSSFISDDGEVEGYITYTYYDLGTTSHPIIEEYLNNL